MIGYLDVPSLKVYLRIGQSDTLDDELLATIVLAVMAEQHARLRPDTFVVLPDDETQEAVPDDVYLAALQRGARLYARRASPEGLVPFGDLGVARIPAFDRDIDTLEAPWRNVVLA